jgi:hypothetical protein
MIGSVERQYAVLHLIQGKLPVPQFTFAQQSSGNQSKTAALFNPRRGIIATPRAYNHFRINILFVAVQIDPRPRAVRHDDRIFQLDTAPSQHVSISVLKPQ